MTGKMSAKKKRTAFILWTLLILLYCGIFLFSAQDGDTSGGISMRLSRQGVKIWDEVAGKELTCADLETMAVHLEHPLRKTAHFAEYAVMGVLVYGILAVHGMPHCRKATESVVCSSIHRMQGKRLVQGMSGRFSKRCLLAVLWVVVSAAADELHQYFVPGRWASVSDVLLDTCGGAVGVILCAIYLSHKKRKA